MEYQDPANRRDPQALLRGLFSIDMLALAWLPVLIIGVFHYSVGPHHHWAHDILRRLYYIPILFAAFSRGRAGGIGVALVTSLTYLPHAFFVMPTSLDPGTTLNKIMEVVLYNTIGILAGTLADRESVRRRQAEQAFADQKRMSEQLIRAGRLAALGELVAGIAHEVKNPLHTIKGTAEIVDEVIPKDADQAPMWNLLRQEVDRLERVADRFLSFARPSFPDLKPVTVGEVYRRIGELVTAQIGAESHVDLEIAPLADNVAGKFVRADRDQIAQIALGITANALRAMEGHGVLGVRGGIREDGADSYTSIQIENDGPIIPTEDLERIFDPFFTASEDGTGLGLAIAARIADEHGGFLEVKNTGSTQGVCFTLVLACTDNAPR